MMVKFVLTRPARRDPAQIFQGGLEAPKSRRGWQALKCSPFSSPQKITEVGWSTDLAQVQGHNMSLVIGEGVTLILEENDKTTARVATRKNAYKRAPCPTNHR